ncbi:hypothetical protein [Streptacidiphilus carbonis]|uniref:hypothetical protein n=1 Tax=Streptacidiphilus carbonis TaxID=105422 RepID=UPI000AE9DF70|nr:hypothetical protein [Streptacidiphilus carbonis]
MAVVLIGIVIALLALAAIAFTLWRDGQGLPPGLAKAWQARRRPRDGGPQDR